jgi:Dolichyl-phosphate-mannose-protein mannosyltransferase
MSQNSATLDPGVVIRRVLFVLVMFSLAIANIFTLFQGLNAPHAMDQAQIAREISRGHGFTTKFVRPIAYHLAQKKDERSISLVGFQDTYHAPLNPLINAAVLKLIGADDPKAWQMSEKELVFPLDRVIAAVCTLFFLMAIGVNYLLISRIFDAKIAGVTAILMLFCELFWNYSLSGLPQMLMLLLFSCAIYFVYRAVEAASEGRIAMTPAVIAGVFFTLLALTHWMTVWIALGYIIYAAIAFRPRGIVAISVLVLLVVAGIAPVVRNFNITGTPFGTAYLTLHRGLGSGSEDSVMRAINLTAEPLMLDGLIQKILRTTLLQSSDIITFLGGILVAPLFFLALLHPFKRGSIASFRWAILLMWVMTTLGLGIYGISKEPLDPNQLHLLFAPIMTAYGIAFVSILWSRLEIVATTPMLRNLHHVVIIAICALPLILSLPVKVRNGINSRDRGGSPHWPPYAPSAINSPKSGLQSYVGPNQVIFSDQPWATAWYADRVSIWLPPTREGFEKLEAAASDLQTPVAGILISPSSHGSASYLEVSQKYRDFTSLVMNGRTLATTYPAGVSIYEIDPRITAIAKRYPYPKPLVGLETIFYSDRATGPGSSKKP